MNGMVRFASIVCAAVLALSCSKDDISQISKDIEFKECHLYASDGNSGLRLEAWTGETRAASEYVLYLYFNDFAGMETGQKSVPVSARFVNQWVNGNAPFTEEYSGSVFLVKKSDTEAEISFDKVTMNILNTDYLFDGCIICPVE